ncbi:MAG: PilW family protein [Gammaproteobacteria bacterium]|nr:PilW family protein [Gammaproteobacteria bacterium]MDH4253363.1 PilW family protein [Gammaproteobacteria bacterium]MDH5310137.1 PilW family protein [Gammaproteobacteria bacterium]
MATIRFAGRMAGVTLVELMVALAIGSFLIIGAVQVYNQSRQAYVINDSIARVQETAQFAMDTIEADLRMASNFGRTSRADMIQGRSLSIDPNPKGLAAPAGCGAAWALDLERSVEGSNNAYALPCAANGGGQGNSDTVTVRRATVAAVPLDAARLQVQSTRIQGEVMDDGAIPAGFDAVTSQTHNLMVSSYYVAASSTLIPGVPTLRRKTLGSAGGGAVIDDIEVAPGVENLQLQFGVDMDGDNTVDRYVNPADAIITPGAVGYVPAARVITARVWLVVRSLSPEIGIVDLADYEPGDVDLGVPNDQFRRLMVSKTILLRNART